MPATYNPNPGPTQTLVHNVLTHLPMGGGAVYNLANSAAHLIQGNLGQWGKAPSLAGRFFQMLGINPFGDRPLFGYPAGTNFSDPNLAQGIGAPGAPQPGAPVPYQQPQQPQNYGSVLPNGVPRSVYETGRFTGAPAFFPTLAQTMFPGSAIGPISGGSGNPYLSGIAGAPTRGDEGLGIPNVVDPSIPGSAAGFMQWVRSRNQL